VSVFIILLVIFAPDISALYCMGACTALGPYERICKISSVQITNTCIKVYIE